MAHISIKNYSKTTENEQQPQPLVETEVNVGHEEEKTTTEKNILEKNVKLVFFFFIIYINFWIIFFKNRKFMTKKQYLKILGKKNRELFLQNIPNLVKQTHLTRKEIHTIYILYKVLQEVTSQRYDDYSKQKFMIFYFFQGTIKIKIYFFYFFRFGWWFGLLYISQRDLSGFRAKWGVGNENIQNHRF